MPKLKPKFRSNVAEIIALKTATTQAAIIAGVTVAGKVIADNPMFNRKFSSGGFVLIEFAIALPLLILLGYGLAQVSLQAFKLGRDQLADYVLEAETNYVMERITHQARVAKEVEVKNFTDKIDQIKFVYHAVGNRTDSEVVEVNDAAYGRYWMYKIFDVLETQYFIPHRNHDREIYDKLHARRQELGALTNPISGDNSFGDTKINSLKCRKLRENVLHVTLEMESLVTERKIKIATAIFMPGCESLTISGGT